MAMDRSHGVAVKPALTDELAVVRPTMTSGVAATALQPPFIGTRARVSSVERPRPLTVARKELATLMAGVV